MLKKGELFLDVVGYVDAKKCPQIYKENREYQNKYNGRFKLGGYKLFLDGSPQGKTAWLTEPYEGDESRGYPIYSDDEAERLCRIAQEEDVQLLTHVNGDAAAEQLLRILAKTKTKRRPVAIHAQVMRRDQIAALKKQNVIPSFFVAHVYHWGDVHLQNLGQERASRHFRGKRSRRFAYSVYVSSGFARDPPEYGGNALVRRRPQDQVGKNARKRRIY